MGLRSAPRALLVPLLAALLGAAPRAAEAFEGLLARADVSGPRGSFTTEIVSLDDGRARFLQVHPDGRAEIVVLDETAFERGAGGGFLPAGAGGLDAVRGHDVARLVLTMAAAGAVRPPRIELPPPAGSERAKVEIELADWRRVHGVELPFAATIRHEGERFDYRFTAVLPFRLAPGTELPAEPGALFDRLGDLGLLVAAHERVMAAHRASDAELLAADAAPVATVSGRGRLTETTREAFLDRMRGYLGSIRFSRYQDTVVPVVAVAADGTLGWLACEMQAEGIQTEGRRRRPIAYGFSWVELYGRPVGAPAGTDWTALGNASSAAP